MPSERVKTAGVIVGSGVLVGGVIAGGIAGGLPLVREQLQQMHGNEQEVYGCGDLVGMHLTKSHPDEGQRYEVRQPGQQRVVRLIAAAFLATSANKLELLGVKLTNESEKPGDISEEFTNTGPHRRTVPLQFGVYAAKETIRVDAAGMPLSLDFIVGGSAEDVTLTTRLNCD